MEDEIQTYDSNARVVEIKIEVGISDIRRGTTNSVSMASAILLGETREQPKKL